MTLDTQVFSPVILPRPLFLLSRLEPDVQAKVIERLRNDWYENASYDERCWILADTLENMGLHVTRNRRRESHEFEVYWSTDPYVVVLEGLLTLDEIRGILKHVSEWGVDPDKDALLKAGRALVKRIAPMIRALTLEDGLSLSGDASYRSAGQKVELYGGERYEGKADITSLLELTNEFVKALNTTLENLLESEDEYRTSDAYLIEDSDGREFYYYASGLPYGNL